MFKQLISIFSLFCILVIAAPVFAQNYQTFQIIRPIAVGTVVTGLDAENRVYRAYTGIPYVIHADAVGGSWPYTYTLTNAPSGMTIEAGPCTTISTTCTAGTITWPSPTGTASNIVVRITDKDGDYVEGTWTVTSSTTIGADGFCFLDASAGNDTTGNGSLVTPWQTLEKARATCGARSILYLRAGTYPTAGMTATDGVSAGYRHKVGFNENATPVIWLAYPGDARPLIEFGATGSNEIEMFDMKGQNVWLEGFEMQNVGCIGFRTVERQGQFGIVVRNVIGHGVLDGYDGGNCSFFMWANFDDAPSHGDTVQLSHFYDTNGGDCALKVYSVDWGLFESSYYHDATFTEAVVALKNSVRYYTVRANKFGADIVAGVGGNMNDGGAFNHTTNGEIYHNLFLGSDTVDTAAGEITLGVGEIDPIGPTWVYRNTFVGGIINVSNLLTVDGPYDFQTNVIVNAGGTGGSCPARLTCYSISDYARLTVNVNNVQGANNGTIADTSTGILVGASRTTYLGVAGFELVDATSISRRYSGRLFLRR